VSQNIFNGSNALRAGRRLLTYGVLVFALGYFANKIAAAALQRWQPDPENVTNVIGYFAVVLCALLLAAWIMARMEGRSLADYGLPWRRAFCGQFWKAWAISFVSLTGLLAVLWFARSFSLESAQLHGAEILKNALL
jgi:hypothetical protein